LIRNCGIKLTQLKNRMNDSLKVIFEIKLRKIYLEMIRFTIFINNFKESLNYFMILASSP